MDRERLTLRLGRAAMAMRRVTAEILRSIKADRATPGIHQSMDATAPRPRSFWTAIRRTPLLVTLSSPLIYSLILPFALMDLWVSLYQAVCFPIYGIEQVKRSGYFKLDRAKLPYLNSVEKLNCQFCAYANGVVGFVREVAARSEQYWCPIKHADAPIDPHARYEDFTAYGAGVEHRLRQDTLRAALRPSPTPRTITPAVRPSKEPRE